MTPKQFITSGIALAFAGTVVTHGATILREYAFNIDGTITDTFNPPGGLTATPGVSYDTFDPDTGLGTLTISVSGLGLHYIGVFFDHDLEPLIDDETGLAVGAPGSGQSWEIDEPGYGNNGYFGDIYANFSGGLLDNSSNLGGTGTPASADDMAMALAWSFMCDADLLITLSQTAPASGFYLQQSDPFGDELFIWGVLTPKGTSVDCVPEYNGRTLPSLFFGLAALKLLRNRSRQ